MKPTSLHDLCPQLPPGLAYGGDYNPEQWPEEVWQEDVRLMREAGVNLVSVGIFSWTRLEPVPGVFDFAWLTRIMDLLWANGVSACLATATASPPAWLSRAHPESLPVDAAGTRLSPGSRQHYCPNSHVYRERGALLIGEIARRLGHHPGLALWHINNEVGCHSYECFCDVCAREFRRWLQAKYASLAALNESWGTAFWSQAYGDWEEILPPRRMPTFRNPGQVLDYARFMSDSLRDVIRGEVQAIRAIHPQARVTTNGLAFHRPADYWSWYREVDVAAWDSYPDPSLGIAGAASAAFNHDLFRSLKCGQPFLLMEQATTQVNWRPVNQLKPPGQMRALSIAAVARGADGIMFFQWRASRAGAEKFHSAMVPRLGTGQGRVFTEVKELGALLKKLAPVCGARVEAKLGVVVSWENRWALELESKPMAFDYEAIVQHFHRALWGLNVGIDLLHPNDSFAGYDVIVAPALYQLTRSQAEALRDFAATGGTLVASYFTGVADDREHLWLGGCPGLLKDVFGMTVEEWQPLLPGETNSLMTTGGEMRCEKFCELLRLDGAQVVATYGRDFFAGSPAITHHRFGRGEAYYVGTHPALEGLEWFFRGILIARKIAPPVETGSGVEAAIRAQGDRRFLFLINHQPASAAVDLGGWRGTDLLSGVAMAGTISLEGYGTRVIAFK